MNWPVQPKKYILFKARQSASADTHGLVEENHPLSNHDVKIHEAIVDECWLQIIVHLLIAPASSQGPWAAGSQPVTSQPAQALLQRRCKEAARLHLYRGKWTIIGLYCCVTASYCPHKRRCCGYNRSEENRGWCGCVGILCKGMSPVF